MEVLFIRSNLRVSVLNLQCNVVRHCCSEEHLKLSEWYFSSVETEDLYRYAQAPSITCEVFVHLLDKVEALLLVFPLFFNAHSSLLVDCFAKEFINCEVFHIWLYRQVL